MNFFNHGCGLNYFFQSDNTVVTWFDNLCCSHGHLFNTAAIRIYLQPSNCRRLIYTLHAALFCRPSYAVYMINFIAGKNSKEALCSERCKQGPSCETHTRNSDELKGTKIYYATTKEQNEHKVFRTEEKAYAEPRATQNRRTTTRQNRKRTVAVWWVTSASVQLSRSEMTLGSGSCTRGILACCALSASRENSLHPPSPLTTARRIHAPHNREPGRRRREYEQGESQHTQGCWWAHSFSHVGQLAM